MTKKNEGSHKGSKPKQGEFRGFFNPTLNSDIKAAVRALDLTDEPTVSRAEELCESGFKVSITADANRTHYTFTLFDRRANSDSQGYVLSVKHSEFEVGIGLLWLLVYEIYEGKGWLPWIKGTTDTEW